MGRPRNRYEIMRKNLSFPSADKKTKAWLDAQKCPSDSMRYLIQAYVRVYGYTDPILSFPDMGAVMGGVPAGAPEEAPPPPAPRQEPVRREPPVVFETPAQTPPVPVPRPVPAPAPVSPPASAPAAPPDRTPGDDIVAKFFD